MSLQSIKVTLKGTTPLLMHAYPIAPIPALEKKTKEEQAEYAAYRDTDKYLYVPGIAVQRALIGAATYSKAKGKGRASLQKPAAACLMVLPERISLGTKNYEIDSRRVVVPATKGAVVRHRPMVKDWRITFTLEFDDHLITEPELRTIVDDMGTRVGLLDFRPAKNGSYGRSIVTEWKNLK